MICTKSRALVRENEVWGAGGGKMGSANEVGPGVAEKNLAS